MRKIFLASLLLLLAGCVTQTLTVRSNPPGALVYLNNFETGRTPVTTEFKWYGTYDLELRREGYETLKAHAKVIAPWWQWVPLDLFAELIPLRLYDHHHLHYALKPVNLAAAEPEVMLKRSAELRTKLESSPRTKTPATTTWTTKPATTRKVAQ